MAGALAAIVGSIGLTAATGVTTAPPAGSDDVALVECEGVEWREHAAIDLGISLEGSEDLAFDGNGGLIARRGSEFVRIAADGTESVVGFLENRVFGVRVEPTGTLVAARPDDGEVIRLTDGNVETIVAIDRPNGVDVAPDGTIWVTGFGEHTVTRIDPDGTAEPVVDGDPADQPNGIVFDASRDLVYFTNYSAGQIVRAATDGSGAEVVAELDGTMLDGLALDVCGDLYVVDNGNNRLYGVPLDEVGDAAGEPVMLAEFTSSVANAQFGAGDGWNPESLYVIGVGGRVFEVPVGVPGQ